MQYSLAYGREQLIVELPENNVVKVMKTQPADSVEDPLDAVFDVLEEPIEAEPLAAIAEGRKSACVVVCDATKPTVNPTILPPILQTLEDAGIDVAKITILIATALRRNSTSDERTEIIGEDIMLRKFKVSDHSSRKLHQHEYLGVTKQGTPIWVDRRYLEAEVKILTGIVEPHSIAGFAGGRKAICPGIAAAETVVACYSPLQIENEQIRPGSVDDNPVHAEQMEIARKAGCDFVVNVILNQDNEIAQVVGGHLNYAFLEGVALARKSLIDTVEQPVDIVVTSGGGSPYDRTWNQAIQGIVGAIDILKPGGTIIIASACDEGIGSEDFEKRYLEAIDQFETIDDAIVSITSEDAEPFIDQWQLQELAKALRKGKVRVVTKGIEADVLRKFFVTPSASVEEAVEEALAEYGRDATIAVIPSGPRVLALAENKPPVAEMPTVASPAAKKKTAKKTAAKKEAVPKETMPKEAMPEPSQESADTAEADLSPEANDESSGTKKAAKKTVKKTAAKKTTKKTTKKSAE